MVTQIARYGGAVIVQIPEELLRKANLVVGDRVEWSVRPDGGLALRAPGSEPTLEVEEGYEEWAREEIEAGLAEAEAGNTVEGDKVLAWVQSWETEHPLPAPR